MFRRRKLMTRSRYAIYRGVRKQAVTNWQNKGLVIFAAPNLVDVDQTDRQLDARPPVYRGGRTSLPSHELRSVRRHSQ